MSLWENLFAYTVPVLRHLPVLTDTQFWFFFFFTSICDMTLWSFEEGGFINQWWYLLVSLNERHIWTPALLGWVRTSLSCCGAPLTSWCPVLLFIFWLHPMACGNPVLWPGIERVAPASLNHWATREVPWCPVLWLRGIWASPAFWHSPLNVSHSFSPLPPISFLSLPWR